MHILQNIEKYKTVYQNILFHISHYMFQYIHTYFCFVRGETVDLFILVNYIYIYIYIYI